VTPNLSINGSQGPKEEWEKGGLLEKGMGELKISETRGYCVPNI